MKYTMPYDDYAMLETQFNCEYQNVLAGFGIYIWAYRERVLHELKLLGIEPVIQRSRIINGKE